MKRIFLIVLMFVTAAGFAAAQIQAPTSDVLGAHLNYGRGCAACHAPHNGAYGNGAAKTSDPTAGQSILWGEDVASLFGQTIITGGTAKASKNGYTEVLPASMAAGTPDVNGLLTCLSCHDGNYAKGAMMKNQIYETLPPTYGQWQKVPTLLGVNEAGAATYLQDHPVGTNAIVGCGGQYNWDCTVSATGTILMTGTNSAQFVQDYGYFVNPAAYTGPAVGGVTPTPVPIVVCTTCHNQHLMNVVKVSAANSGQPAGLYATMFFLAGPYNPASVTPGSNQTAQFCRQCHGGEANESNGYNAPTVF
jgi:cytochrome c553